MKRFDEVTGRVRENLEKVGVPFEEDDEGLWVEPRSDTGFSVGLTRDENELTVWFEFWHWHFDKEDCDGAEMLFMLGLTNGMRLRLWSAGDAAYKARAEQLVENEWRPISTTTLVWFIPFWKKKREEVYQNSFPDEFPLEEDLEPEA